MKVVLNKERFFKILAKVNFGLFVSAIILAVCLVFGIVHSYRPFFLKRTDFRAGSFEFKNKGFKYPADKIPVFDENIFRERGLFNTLGKVKEQKQDSGFQLLGIVSLGGRYTAMIKDVKENMQYHCSEGEVIGGFKVKEIFKHKVILEIEGKILELIL